MNNLDRQHRNRLEGNKTFGNDMNSKERTGNNREEGIFKGTFTGKVKHIKEIDSKDEHDQPIKIFAYGFIVPDDATLSDVFVHYKDIEPWRTGFKELKQGDVVKFDVHETRRGLQARNVEVKREPTKLGEFKTAPETFGNR